MGKLPDEDAEIRHDPEFQDLETSEAGRVKAKHEMNLLSIDGVVGVGLGSSETGGDVIVIYLEDDKNASALPDEIEGIPIRFEITGPINAL